MDITGKSVRIGSGALGFNYALILDDNPIVLGEITNTPQSIILDKCDMTEDMKNRLVIH